MYTIELRLPSRFYMIFPMRINKYLTEANYCSRREADRLIEKREVGINAKKAILGDKVQKGDRVYVKGREVKLTSGGKIYLAFYKPIGIISTTDPRAKDNIVQYLKYPKRVYPIGRLDVASSGLILLTNDGEIVNKILKAEHKIEKEYVVQVDKRVRPGFLEHLRQGVVLEGYKTLPAKVKRLSDNSFSIILIEGKNRQIRRMCNAFGYGVTSLTRVRIGGIKLGDLHLGIGGIKELSRDLIGKFLKV